jgi:histidinol-phosphate phosphatase family protein
MNKAVFLDRDGTLNLDKGFTYKPEDLQLLPCVPEALSMLQSAGFLLVVITNQSGIGRGFFTQSDVEKFHLRMQEEFEKKGVKIDAFYICPHAPEENCQCRKPSPYLIIKASQDMDIDLSTSYMVGDRSNDVSAGEAAGVKSFLITKSQSILYWAKNIVENT